MPNQHGKRFGMVLAAIAFFAYAVLPTKNYYWDGVSFALHIEQAGAIGSASLWANLIHPNHLLYNALGYFSWKAATSAGIRVRAIVVLQILNMLFGAACVGMIYAILLKITRSSYLALSLALCFGFSAVFWRFSTDADAYIGSVFFLILAFRLLCADGKPRPITLAFVHAAAMLLHQLAVLFLPAAAIAMYLKGGWRSLLKYCAVASALTVPAFYFAFRLATGHSGQASFLAWLSSHSPDVSFTFTFPRNLGISLANYPRLFFGGTGHLLRFFGPAMCIGFALLALSIGALLKRSAGHNSDFKALLHRPDRDFSLQIAVAWAVPYIAFLFFWLPGNTFYKLFCLPAFIVVAAHICLQYRGPRRHRLLLFSAVMIFANFSFYIFPYSRPTYNQAFRLAQRLSSVWSGQTVVYYSDFIVDDWYVRYFNPASQWKLVNPAAVSQEIEADLAAGRDVWLDSTAVGALTISSPETKLPLDPPFEDKAPRHTIRFYRWAEPPSHIR